MMNKLQNGVSQYASMRMQHGNFSPVQIIFERRTVMFWQATCDPILATSTAIFILSCAGDGQDFYYLTVRLRWCNDLFALRYVCLLLIALRLESICYSVSIGCEDRWI